MGEDGLFWSRSCYAVREETSGGGLMALSGCGDRAHDRSASRRSLTRQASRRPTDRRRGNLAAGWSPARCRPLLGAVSNVSRSRRGSGMGGTIGPKVRVSLRQIGPTGARRGPLAAGGVIAETSRCLLMQHEGTSHQHCSGTVLVHDDRSFTCSQDACSVTGSVEAVITDHSRFIPCRSVSPEGCPRCTGSFTVRGQPGA